MKKYFILFAFIGITAACQGQKEVYSTKAGAIKGYDPVAYFTEDRPVKGDDKYSFDWNGATWHFSSQEHLDMFKASPEKYSPQYGGFCAFGVANGYKVKIEPDAWAIVDDKLYLNYDAGVQEEWNADRDGFINKADSQWNKIKKD